MKKKESLVIVGKGAFGDLIEKFLKPHFSVQFVRRSDTDLEIKEKISGCRVLIFSVPMIGLEYSIMRTKNYVARETLVIDVTSVKVKPLHLLKKHFKHNQVLGTHPILGPQSVKKNKNSLAGLPLVLCQETTSDKTYKKIKQFCKKELGCRVIEQTAAQHDKEMAHVQGLSHFIGRALKQLDIANYQTSTESYRQLVELKDLLAGDSWELFETIENTNPEAKKVRKKFVLELAKIEKKLASK